MIPKLFVVCFSSLLLFAACAASADVDERIERSEHEIVAGSCSVDACGGQSTNDLCWCDDLCDQFGDCCDDIAAVCGP